MNDMHARNLDVVRARWPALAERVLAEPDGTLAAEILEGQDSTLRVGGVQLTSRHGREAEARFQLAAAPAAAQQLHLYGPALGDLPRLALADPRFDAVHVHILNGALFALVLQLLDHTDWLGDPRLHLAYASDADELQLPLLAMPSELVLADDANSRMRDRLVSELHLEFNNRRFATDHAEVIERLANAGERVAAERDVAELFETEPGRPAYLIATGPSLQEHYTHLAAVNAQAGRPLFICVDTALKPLLEHGITPDVVVGIDRHVDERHLRYEQSAGIALVYMPLLAQRATERWQGPRYVAYSTSPMYERLRSEHPKALLFSGGCVLHPAVDLAVKMGSNSITLFGADFAFPHGRTHAGWADGELGGPGAAEAKHWVLDGHGQRVATQLSFRGYLCELERYIARHPGVRFSNSSRSGARIVGAGYREVPRR